MQKIEQGKPLKTNDAEKKDNHTPKKYIEFVCQPSTKMYSKWIINLKFRLKFRDYIEKNIGSTLQDLELNGLK